jgi:hypothetical protein
MLAWHDASAGKRSLVAVPLSWNKSTYYWDRRPTATAGMMILVRFNGDGEIHLQKNRCKMEVMDSEPQL